MKTFNLLLSNAVKAVLTVAVLFVFMAAQAQDEGEKGKVHVKVIKEENGKTTVIDTVFACQPGSLEKQIQVVTGEDFEQLMGGDMEKVLIKCDSSNGDHKIIKVVKNVEVEKEGEQEFTVIMNDEDGEPGKIKKCIESDDCKVIVLKLKTDGKENNEFTFSYVITGVLAPEDKQMLEKSGVEADIKEQNQLKTEDFQIFPNPGDGNFKLSFSSEEKGELSVQVFDLKGSKVFEDHKKSFGGSYENTIDITTEGKGMYFLKVAIGSRSLVKKLEISKE